MFWVDKLQTVMCCARWRCRVIHLTYLSFYYSSQLRVSANPTLIFHCQSIPVLFNVSITSCFPSIPVHQHIMSSFHPKFFFSRHCVAMNSPVIALQKHCTAPSTCNATTMHNQTILSFEVEIHTSRLINKSIIKVVFLFKFHPSRQFSNPSNSGFQLIKKPF